MARRPDARGLRPGRAGPCPGRPGFWPTGR